MTTKPKTGHLTVAEYALAEEMSHKGARMEDIARALKVSRPTLRKMIANDELLAEAIDGGRGRMHGDLVGKLYQKAMSGNVQALIFALKSMYGYSEQGPDDAGRTAVTINLPGSLSMEEYNRLVEVKGRVVGESGEGSGDE